MLDNLTVKELADMIGVTPGRVRQLVTEGNFPNSVKRGNTRLIPLKDIIAFLESEGDKYQKIIDSLKRKNEILKTIQ